MAAYAWTNDETMNGRWQRYGLRALWLAAMIVMGHVMGHAADGENYVRTTVYGDASGSSANARETTSYFDGLGRERYVVMDGAGRDPVVIQDLEYDADGRLVKDETRQVTSVTYHPYTNLPNTLQTSDGSNVISTYFSDGTLNTRRFMTRRINIVVKVDANGDTVRTEKPTSVIAMHTYMGNYEWTADSRCLYHTPAGHYDTRARQHYWHVRDRLGSTVAVTDASGTLLQATGYYPSGTPYRLPDAVAATEITAKTDQLHIGNRWIGHKGLNIYDNTARLHDPVLMRFHTPDSKYASYPSHSPWAHCTANPLAFIDPDGERPTDLEGAFISQHIYNGKVGDKLPGNWVMNQLYEAQSSTSFRAGMYSRALDDGSIEYAVAYAGTFTDKRFIKSAYEDFAQFLGSSSDMSNATSLANKLSNVAGDCELTFVGHSKGGAEATGGALTTGRDAITYNTAMINSSSISSKGNSSITNIIVKGEFISGIIAPVVDLLNNFNIATTVSYVGEIKTLEYSESSNPFKKHEIEAVINILSIEYMRP